MRKIKSNFFISLDGVVESPDQWHFPYFDDEMGAAVGGGFATADAMLMGRRLYEEWAAYWPEHADEPFGEVMNSTKKYVISNSLQTADWQNTELISGDVAAEKLTADVARGKAVFKKTCATCHRLENEGTEVGPDLLSALRNKTPEGLVIDILDPSREVDPRYINYVVTTKNGQLFTGLVAAETASSVTLRRAEKAEDTILRTQIEEIQATAKSLMPDNLETQLNKQDLADVIAYLQAVAAK